MNIQNVEHYIDHTIKLHLAWMGLKQIQSWQHGTMAGISARENRPICQNSEWLEKLRGMQLTPGQVCSTHHTETACSD
jgi:hypothetical protein